MDCFPDFCLACDKQTMDGLYCSQACRLADLEKGSPFPSSPSASSSSEHEGWPYSRSSRFSLPPGFDFSFSKTSTKHTHHNSSTSATATPKERTLSPSTSRSSLNSTISTTSAQTNQIMSEQAQMELNGYVSSFDAIREIKRRSLSSISGH